MVGRSLGALATAALVLAGGVAVRVDRGTRLESVPVYGADRDWTAALAKPFELEGRSLLEFLDWICAENGWLLRFADPAVERKAATTILHGSIDGLTPEEALSAVLSTAGLEHQLENRVLRIRVSSSETKRSE